MHPVAQVWNYGHPVRRRCFVSNGMRMILPSLGNYSAGSNVLGSAFNPLLGQGGLFVWCISQERVTFIAFPNLMEDRVEDKRSERQQLKHVVMRKNGTPVTYHSNGKEVPAEMSSKRDAEILAAVLHVHFGDDYVATELPDEAIIRACEKTEPPPTIGSFNDIEEQPSRPYS